MSSFATNPLFQQENAVHASLANGIPPAGGPGHGREPSWQDGRARKEHEVTALLDSIRSNRGDPMYSAFAAHMDNLYQVFKELHEQDQLEIRQLLGALEVQRAEAQKLASEANSARHALQVAERDREASAVAAAAAMAAARATGATGPSSRSRVEMASVGVQMDGDGDADVNSRVVGRGVAGGGGGGSGRPERGRVRLAGGPGGGALEEDGDSSASPPRALQALGSRRTRMWNTGGGSGSKASSVMGSPSGRKWSRPAYILFLPYHLHPGHPMWRFYATWLESWSTRRTMWLALAWLLVFLLAVGLLVGLLVPWDNLSKTTMSEPAVANSSSSGATVTLSLNRAGLVYYVVVPEAATSGGPSAAAATSSSSGRRRRHLDESASYASGGWWAEHVEAGLGTRRDYDQWDGAEERVQGRGGDGPLIAQLGRHSGGGPHYLNRRQLRGQHPPSHEHQLHPALLPQQPYHMWPHSMGRRRGRSLAESSSLRRLDLRSLEPNDLVAVAADGGDDSPLLPYAVACGVVDISSKNTNYSITLAGRPELLPVSLTSTGAAVTFAATYNSSAATELAERLAAAASSTAAAMAAECVSNFGLQLNETSALPSWSGARFRTRRCQRCPRLLPGTSYVVLLLGDGGRRTGVQMVRFETSSVAL